jgi:riboflavin synthase
MFTGLIETVGTVLAVEKNGGSTRIAVVAPGIGLHTGDSIAVSGVCLTALDIEPGRFQADLAAETIARTSLSQLAPGALVNLELPTRAGAPLGGHVVQGHVDGTGTLLSLDPVGKQADWWLKVAVPNSVSRYVVEKGSIAIEGISLTVARWEPGSAQGDVVSVAIIPHTYAHTNLHSLEIGQKLNLEADVLIKFMEQRAQNAQTLSSESPFELSVAYLIANGY